MAEKIIIEASDVWEYAQHHRSELNEEAHVIAENEDFGIEICISIDRYYPVITVSADNIEIYEESIFSQFSSSKIVSEVYETYLTTSYVTSVSEKSDEDSAGDNIDKGDLVDEEELIVERELELDDAIENFLSVVDPEAVTSMKADEFEKLKEDVKDHFLEYLARKHNLQIYRPMYLEYDDGDEFELYPYDNMVFEDETNPIYA